MHISIELEDIALTFSGQRKRLTLTWVFMWVKNSWEKIRKDVVIRLFKKCDISNTMDGIKEDILFDHNVRSNDEVSFLFQAIVKIMRIF